MGISRENTPPAFYKCPRPRCHTLSLGIKPVKCPACETTMVKLRKDTKIGYYSGMIICGRKTKEVSWT